MGVNLDMKKGNLYRTFGVDYYRRNLKSIVKGNSQLDKDFDNPNEVMKINSNSFPEFENYIINDNNNMQPNLAILNNLEIDLGANANYNADVINVPMDLQNNNNDNNNNIKIAQENKIESIKNEPENQQSSDKKEGEENNGENNDIKKVMDYSIKNMIKFGNFVKKEGIIGFGLAKKYGGILAQKSKPTINNMANYVKNHVPYFNKNKDNNNNSQENNEKEDEKNQ